MDVQIRKITVPDMALARELSELYRLAGWSDGADGQDGQSLNILRNSFCCFGAFDSGRLVGFFRALSDGVSDAYLLDMFVRPEYRGRGIAGGLCRAVLACLKESGVGYITCISTPEGLGVYKPLSDVMQSYTPMKFR